LALKGVGNYGIYGKELIYAFQKKCKLKVKVKVKQSRYRPGVAQKFPGS
jgi:hypothetical protein